MFLAIKNLLIAILLIVSVARAAETIEPLLGPILHFNGQDLKDKSWHTSALYLLDQKNAPHPMLMLTEGTQIEFVKGQIIGQRFGHDFVRYSMKIKQTKQMQKIFYGLANDKNYSFTVPALGQPHHILYHSCNGYQSEKDRKKVGGISPMWQEIINRHSEKPYVLQIGGGDQIYADGLVNQEGECSATPHVHNAYGVFALNTLQPWIKYKYRQGYAAFTDEMKKQVEFFYFSHYVDHYKKPYFKEAMATIPSIAQPDDHDFYDGCGSYPDYLQQSPVMSGIRRIGMWYAFTIQHQIIADDYVSSGSKDATPYHFMYVVNDGKLAIYGVDTRSERTPDQVVSEEQWKKIFSDLKSLDERVVHLVFMLGIPVVYAPSKKLDKAFKSIDALPLAPDVLPRVPMAKSVFKRNAFDLFELADDLRDGWSHPAHHAERDKMITMLQYISNLLGIRVSIISGDVHLGGFGTIGSEKRKWTNDTIAQIISSPVGNVTPKKATAHVLASQGCAIQKLSNGSTMCLHKLTDTRTGKEKKHGLIAHRNFVSMELLGTTLSVLWSAEGKRKKSPFTHYVVKVPAAEKEF